MVQAEKTFKKREHFLDLSLYRYGMGECSILNRESPMMRGHYIFYYITSGTAVFQSKSEGMKGKEYEIPVNQGFLICPGQSSALRLKEKQPWHYVWLELDGLRAMEYLASAGLGLAQPVYCPRESACGLAVREEMVYIVQHSDESSLHLVGHLFLFMDKLIQSTESSGSNRIAPLRDAYVQEAIDYMTKNYHRNVTVEEIADLCKLNRSYFSKLFKETIGCPPQEFLIQMRLSKAAELMKTSNASIRDVSAACGYPNQLHFSRVFKKYYGLSPRAWRIQNQHLFKKNS